MEVSSWALVFNSRGVFPLYGGRDYFSHIPLLVGENSPYVVKAKKADPDEGCEIVNGDRKLTMAFGTLICMKVAS